MGNLPRFDNLPDEKQQRILHAAASEFVEHGFEKASLNRIIDAASISKGAMYYYFHDKAHLYVAVLNRMVLSVYQELPLPDRANLTYDNYWSSFERYMAEFAAHVSSHPEVVQLAKTLQPLGHRKHEEPFKQLYDHARIWLREILDAGQEVGAIREDLPLELMMNMWMAVDEVLDEYGVQHWMSMTAQQQHEFVLKSFDVYRRMFEQRDTP